MKEIQRLRDANQLVESRDPDSDDSTENSSPVEPPQPKPRPPIIPGNAILTPIPVTVATSNATGSQSGSSGDETAQTGQTSIGDSEGGKSKTSTKESDTVAALGEMSIREFEGNINNDPFEITSLQAINDMEILQTVLQPIPPPIMTSASAGTTNTSAARPPPAPPTSIIATGPAPCSTHQASTNSPTFAHSSGSSSNLQLLNQAAVVVSSSPNAITPPGPSRSASSAALPPSLPVQVPQRAGSSPVVGVASGSSPSNPFLAGGAVFATSTTVAPVSNQMVHQFQQQPPVLPISIGAPPVSTTTPPISTNPFSAVSPPAVSATSSFPLPPSSTGATNVGTLINIGQQPMPTSTAIPPVATGGSPNIPPRSNPPIPRPRTAPAAHSSSAPSQTTAAAPVPAQRSAPPPPKFIVDTVDSTVIYIMCICKVLTFPRLPYNVKWLCSAL